MENNDIGHRIRQIRIVSGVPQKAFANLLGRELAVSTISAYESGKLTPSTDLLKLMAQLGGVTLDDLREGGAVFEEKIGKEAARIEANRTRMRDNKPHTGSPVSDDIRRLLNKLEAFKELLGETTEKLTKKEEVLGLQASTDEEKRLLKAFRALPDKRKTRLLEDAEELVTVINSPVINTDNER